MPDVGETGQGDVPPQGQVSPLFLSFIEVGITTKLLGECIWIEITGESHFQVPELCEGM